MAEPLLHKFVLRPIAKAMVYRLVNALVQFIILFLLTKRFGLSLIAVILINFMNLLLYFIHKGSWLRFSLFTDSPASTKQTKSRTSRYFVSSKRKK